MLYACYEWAEAHHHSDTPKGAFWAVDRAAVMMAAERIEHDAGKKTVACRVDIQLT